VLNNDEETQDVLSEVFSELWRNAERYSEQRGKALGWIITIARRRAIDRVRKLTAYSRATDRLEIDTVINSANADFHNAADDAGEADRSQIFLELMDKLPAGQKEALTLTYYRGMSQRQISVHTGVALGTIKTRLELAVRKMRAFLLTVGGEREWVTA
jgi:RNA polymerase sigma-70 factor (ECF subfamily)